MLNHYKIDTIKSIKFRWKANGEVASMKKKLAFIMAGLLCVASLVSCKSSNSSEGNKKEETPKVTEDTRDHSKMIIAISESQKEFYTMAIAK